MSWFGLSGQRSSRHGAGTGGVGDGGRSGFPTIAETGRNNPEPAPAGPSSSSAGGAQSQWLPSRLEDFVPRVIFYPFIGQSFVDAIKCAEHTIIATAYCFDHEEGCAALRQKAEQGVQIRILLDHGKWRNPSCMMQPQRIEALMRAGVTFRTLNVEERGRYAILHTKSFVFDGLVYMGGSANFTNNACVSEENLIFVRDQQIITDHLAWFESLWHGPGASEITTGTSRT